ncbi:MAG: sensor histidine kinase, partial [Clostridia bacterium]|nr:sensor histidine kinase [Clostridia bacterium]
LHHDLHQVQLYALHQVIYNLTENALKFSAEGGELSYTFRRGKDNMTEITVQNDGTGIPKEDLPYVFDRFYKSDKSRGLDKKGVGLGLYIVKTLINAHGGTIRAESEEGKYCRFSFTLPTYVPTEDDNIAKRQRQAPDETRKADGNERKNDTAL